MKLTGIADVIPCVADALRAEEGLVIATVIAVRSAHDIATATRLLIPEQSEPRGSIHPMLDSLLVEHGRWCLQEKRPRVRSYALRAGSAEMVGSEGGDVDIYFDVLARAPRLLIVGGGHIALPLARIALLLEFEVKVIDDRPEFANEERFPEVDEILIGPYRPTLARVPIDSDTYIVLVTRGHVHDQACLELVLDSPAAYIGMIGSKRRVRTVMRHAGENGHDPVKLGQVYAPIGLDIASHTPAEIAVAIMAEIVNVRRGGRAPSLSQRERVRD